MNPPPAGPSIKSLDRTFVGGLAWTAGGKWATQVVTWGSVLILARLLSPKEFGIVGMAGVYLVLTSSIAEFGLAGAVMLMRELGKGVLAQLNTVALLLCGAGFGVCVATAPLVAWFFRVEDLAAIVIVNSTAILLTAFQLVPIGLLRRNMDYRRLATAEASEAIARAVVTVVFAFLGYSYWAILIGGLSARALATAMIYRWHPIPFAVPRWSEIRVPLRFGMQLTIGNFASTLSGQADGIVVGRMLGDGLLGSYQMAMTVARAPAQKVTELLFRVTGPLFASIQNDAALIRRYYLIFLEALLLVLMPVVLGLALVAPEAVRLILGAKWDSAVDPVRVLALYGGLQTLIALGGQVLVTFRRTRFTMNMSVAMLVALPASFVIGAQWGLAGVALCWLLSAPFILIPYHRILLRDLALPLRELLGSFLPSAVSSSAMLAAIVPLRWWLQSLGLAPALSLAIVIAAGGLAYGLMVLVFWRGKVQRYVRFLDDLRHGATPTTVVSEAGS